MMRTTQQTASRKEGSNTHPASGSRKGVVSKKGGVQSSRSINSDNILNADSSSQEKSLLAEDLEARIAVRAHQLYEQRGGCHGEDQADWFEAERQILATA